VSQQVTAYSDFYKQSFDGKVFALFTVWQLMWSFIPDGLLRLTVFMFDVQRPQ